MCKKEIKEIRAGEKIQEALKFEQDKLNEVAWERVTQEERERLIQEVQGKLFEIEWEIII